MIMFKKYIFIMLICLSGTASPQNADSLIQIYPGIGDTLNFFTRTYIGLYPEIEDYEYATFFVRNNDSLVSKIYSSNEDSISQLIRIQNIHTLDSIRIIIGLIDQINFQLFDIRPDFYLITKNGNEIEGQLEMFDNKYLYIIAENIRADHVGKIHYRFPVSQLSQFIIEGNSNVVIGMCVGGIVGSAIGLIVAEGINNSKPEYDNSLDNCGSGVATGVSAAAAFAAIALGGFLIGTITGAATSTDDEIIIINSERDLLKLKGYSAYVLDKETLKNNKYLDIY
jgi:small nuclear ribonucleoprotein (snRNP)-like protein